MTVWLYTLKNISSIKLIIKSLWSGLKYKNLKRIVSIFILKIFLN
jgi:hypothetical protein